MTDNIRTDAIELLCTKEDFIELMDDNCKQLEEIERLTAEYGDEHIRAVKAEIKNKRLRAALERIEGMAERPRCVCGVLTGTAAIKKCASEALTLDDAPVPSSKSQEKRLHHQRKPRGSTDETT